MAEDAKRTTDEAAEQKSGQELNNNPGERNESEAKEVAKASEGLEENSERSDEQANESSEKDTGLDEEKVESDEESGELAENSQSEENSDESANGLAGSTEKHGQLDEKSDKSKEKFSKLGEKVCEVAANEGGVAAKVKVEGGKIANFKIGNDADSEDDADDELKINIELEDKKGDEFQKSVREQIENCKFEIVSSIQESVHKELGGSTRAFRKLERRRRLGFWLRDIIILILAALLGFAIYCLYDAQYFDFMKPECVRENTCTETAQPNDEVAELPEEVKDTAWYIKNYGSLFEALKLNLSADNIGAYYLYSSDYKLSEIQPHYLLGMAYNALNATETYDSADGIVIPAADMQTAFTNLFGTTEYFAKTDFAHGCINFTYDKASDSFVTPTALCADKSNRKIVEEITEAYDEGNVLYFMTVAGIYDQTERALYSFDNLFKPAVKNTDAENLQKYLPSLNQYQYRFKKADGKYYFSDITKLD